jgi:hypothetical protein
MTKHEANKTPQTLMTPIMRQAFNEAFKRYKDNPVTTEALREFKTLIEEEGSSNHSFYNYLVLPPTAIFNILRYLSVNHARMRIIVKLRFSEDMMRHLQLLYGLYRKRG